MTEPTFAVPLSALVRMVPRPDCWRWLCLLDSPDIGMLGRCASDRYDSEPEARSAAIEHLADVHGIVPVGAEETVSDTPTESYEIEWAVLSEDGIETCRSEEDARRQMRSFYSDDASAHVACCTVTRSEWEEVPGE